MRSWLLWLLVIAIGLLLMAPFLGVITYIAKSVIYIIGTLVLIGVIIWAMLIISKDRKERDRRIAAR